MKIFVYRLRIADNSKPMKLRPKNDLIVIGYGAMTLELFSKEHISMSK
jgi:hypothetical protein